MGYKISDLPPELRSDFDTNSNKSGGTKPYSVSDLPASMQSDFAEKPKLSEDVARSTGSGTARGIAAIPGMLGSLGQAYDYVTSLPSYGIAKIAEKTVGLPRGATAEQMMADLNKPLPSASEAEKKGYVNKIFGLPVITSAGSIEAARRLDIPYVTRPIGYKPKTPIGSMVQAGFEAAPQAVVFGPANWGSNYLMGLGMGAAGEGTRQFVKGTNYEKYATPLALGASLLAGLPFAGYQVAKTMRSEPETSKRALAIAGQAQREAYPDPKAAALELAAKISEQKSGKYLPGVELSTAQLTRNPSAQGLETSARRHGTPTSSEEIQILDQKENLAKQTVAGASQAALREAEGSVPKIDVSTIFNITPDAQLTASATAKDAITRIGKDMWNNQKDEWLKLDRMGAAVNKNAALTELEGFINSLGVIPANFFPKEFKETLAKLRASSEAEIPFTDLQTLRSLALDAAKKAYNSGSPIHAPNLYQFANKIKTVLDDENNLVLPDRTAIDQWNAARSASNTYNDFFGDGKFAGALAKESGPGVPKITPEKTLDKMLMSDKGPENLRQIRSTPGVDIDKHVSDYMVGKLTNNGTKLNLTPEDVAKFMADPKNQAIIREVPGLENRLSEISRGVGKNVISQEQTKLVSDFEKAINNPNSSVLADFISSNKNELKNLMPQAQHEFLDQLENSAGAFSHMKPGKMTGTQTMDMLENGNLITLLYGKVTGRIPSAIASSVAGLFAGGPHGLGAGFIAGLSGATAKFSPAIDNFFSNYIFGKTRDQALMALQRAAHDPEFAYLLMQKPSPEVIKGFMDAMVKTGAATGRQALKTGIVTTPKSESEQDQEGDVRIGRATGGRIMNHRSEAENLIRLADKTKKALNNSTESLLAVPDEAVTKALSIANEAI
jgi:hypothetical protein